MLKYIDKNLDQNDNLVMSNNEIPKILIVFSSIGGNTELVVQKVAQLIEYSQKAIVKIIRVDSFDMTKPELLDYHNCLILASPTYGQGTIETHFPPFLKTIKSKVANKNCAVIGLGDNKYYPEYLTESGAILEKYVTDNGGNILVPALRIGMPPIKFIEKLVPKWVEKLLNSLEEKN
jgi:flavodoxin